MARTKAGKFVQETAKQILTEKNPVVQTAISTGKAEGFASALALIFDGRPKYYKLQDGRTVFQWEGDELRKAQRRVLTATKGNPNAEFIVDYLPVAMPSVLRGLAPVIILGGLYVMAKKRGRR